jgi:hypothetical protein
MIKPGEIQNKAREAKVRDYQIEKDYILCLPDFEQVEREVMRHLKKFILN